MRMMTGRRLTDGICGNVAQPGWTSSRQSLGMSCCLLSCPLWSRSFGYAQYSAGLGLTHRFQWKVLSFCTGFARYCPGGMNSKPQGPACHKQSLSGDVTSFEGTLQDLPS